MSRPTNKYTYLEGQRLEIDEDNAELFQKYLRIAHVGEVREE